METPVLILLIAAAVVVLLVVMGTMYVKAPPSYAYILSGIKRVPRVMIGTGGFKIPVFERLDRVYLGQVTVDVKTNKSVPTHDFINVNVDAVCKVRVQPSDEGTRLAAKNFLNMDTTGIAAQVQDSLEGNMREVIGALTLEEINTNRDAFSDQIQSKASPDMEKLGLEIISCNIQNVTDDNNLIRDLGADNTYAIKKNAAITKANAEKEISIAEQNAKKEANDIRVKTETEISERNNELSIKQSELKMLSDTKKADADAAYEIQRQEQQKTINTKTVDAQIEQTMREQILSQERIKITENELKAQVNAKADAEKYAAMQEAAAIEAKGRAQAAAIEANLNAEAEGIRAKGLAEAEAMEKKAEAYDKYGQVAIIDMLTRMNEKVLPEVAKSIAEPMSKIGNMTVYGTSGTEPSGVAQNVPTVIKQTFDVMKDVTGVDMADIAKANSIEARVNKNISIDGLDGVVKK